MQKNGKYLLMTMQEFNEWLFSTRFNREIRLIQNHHTYSPGYAQFDGKNHFNLLLNMETYHLHSAGFSDIAQNLTVFPDGLIAVCRPFDVAPAGIKGANEHGICIENIGNFDAGKDVMTDKQRKSIIFTNAILCMRFNLTPNTDTIVYHHWYDLNTGKRTNGTGTTKTCPGMAFFGGNSVKDAETNFIPLIINQVSSLKDNVLSNLKSDTKISTGGKVFNDFDKVSDWAKPAVLNMKELGIFLGSTEGNFDPQTPVTKEQLAVVIFRVMQFINKA